MATGLENILQSLTLNRLDSDGTVTRFTGSGSDDSGDRIYGGQVMAQAMSAAQQTVDPAYQLHAMHSSFLRQGALDRVITYEVDAVRDGRSFLTRNIVALQQNDSGVARPIFSATLSFHKHENGPQHAVPMPDAPAPDTLISEKQRIADFFDRIGRSSDYDWPIDVRIVDPIDLAESLEGIHD